MIESVHVRNFQSLHDVELPLGRFTVIVGASSSGKTALMRALRGLASNVRGSSVITQGRKAMSVSARTGEATITLSRTAGAGEYRIARAGRPDEVFTKLTGSVPAEVSAALGIAPAPGPHFASQFDAPYLLDESGATVARILGELTNVHAIFEAVAKGNQRKKQASALLKTRVADLNAVAEQLDTFDGLDRRVAAVERAQEAAVAAEAVDELLRALRDAAGAVAEAETQLARRAPRPLPDGAALRDAARAWRRAREDVRAWYTAQVGVEQARQELAAATARQAGAAAALAGALEAAGRCPTCKRPTGSGSHA